MFSVRPVTILFIIIGLVAVIGVVATIVQEFPQKQICPVDIQQTDKAIQSNGAPKADGNSEKSIFQKTKSDPVAIFNFVLSIVAVFQVLLLLGANSDTAKAANAAKKSAEISEKALIVTQRAFVRVSNFPWVWRPDFDRPGKYFYDITPMVENAGNTPTVEMKIVVDFALRDSPLPDDFNFPYRSLTGVSIIGGRQTVGANSAIILDHDLQAIQQGKKFFYIWGTITYRDSFEGTPLHTTKFCSQVVRVFGNPLDPRDSANPKGTSVEINFSVYPKHNYTD